MNYYIQTECVDILSITCRFLFEQLSNTKEKTQKNGVWLAKSFVVVSLSVHLVVGE